MGLFTVVGAGAEVRNLQLAQTDMVGSDYYVGGLVGTNYGIVTGCSGAGTVVGGTYAVGGLVGFNVGTVIRCHSACAVSGSTAAEGMGGLVGRNDGSVILCDSAGTVRTGTGSTAIAGFSEGGPPARSPDIQISGGVSTPGAIGGLVGLNYAMVTYCRSSASVTGTSRVGGLVGGNSGPVTGCYSTGAVSGATSVGGLVGSSWGSVTACFWDTQTAGQATSAGGTGKTTAEMQRAKTFLDAGWDWVGEVENGTAEVWQAPEGGGYPVLAIFNGYTPPVLQGLGTAANPYVISNAMELGAVIYGASAHYRLAGPIDLSRSGWIASPIPWFGGGLDGRGHTISHLTIAGGGYLGLLGGLGSGAQIRDLGVVDVEIVASGPGGCVGGLAASNGGAVTRCYSSGASRVSGTRDVGGLIGYNTGTITCCFSTVTVSGVYERIGGLVGGGGGRVTDCYSAGSVTGTDYVGGLIGSSYADATSHSYSTGAVTGTGPRVGGLAGNGGGVRSGVWDMQTSGRSQSSAGIGLTTAEMMDPEMLGMNGFAGDPNWVLDVGRDYPRLAWEGKPGRIIPAAHAGWMKGDGTAGAPYRVDTREQLVRIGRGTALWDKQFVLDADIDLDSNRPGGQTFGQAVIPIFSGVFDGNGHTISHLTIKGQSNLGLVAQLEAGAEVRNLGLVEVSVVGTGETVGALAGGNAGVVTHCYSTGTVSGLGTVGGLVGSNSGSVIRCYSSGAITTGSSSQGYGVGGLVGSNGGTLTNCYSMGAVRGTSLWAGLIGSNTGTVTRCYSTGSVSGAGLPRGGLVASNSGVVLHAIWDRETSGWPSSAVGVGLTTSQMMDAATLGLNGFGNDPNWGLDAGRDYPRLAWEGKAGQIIPEPEVDWLVGRGTAEAPYVVGAVEQLTLITHASFLWEKHFVLGADLDLAPSMPDGQVFAQAIIPLFLGIFDGNDHSISHLTIKGGSDAGLFGRLRPGAEVRNLAVIDADVTGSDRVGALAGFNDGGYLTHCFSTGAVQGGSFTGGLVGNNGGHIAQCYSLAACNGKENTGGLVGYNYGRIMGAFAAGAIRGSSSVGGLIGQNYGDVTACYSAGAVGGDWGVGGLVGSGGAPPAGCFWDTQTSGQTVSAGGTGLTTAGMQNITTYLAAGWDFLGEVEHGTWEIWQMPQRGYPALAIFNGYAPPQLPGRGTPEEPYLIASALDLGTMIHHSVSAHYRLAASIDLTGIRWSAPVIPWFAGTFDGSGHTIAHLKIGGGGSLGLFGRLQSGAEVRDLGVTDVNVTGSGTNLGGLAAWNEGHVSRCYVTGVISGASSNVGGLVGYNSGDVTDCRSAAAVVGAYTVGGLVGYNQGNMSSCHSTGPVHANGSAGGLAGGNGGTVTQCYSAGAVSATEVSIGGLVGYNRGDVTSCYSTAAVHGGSSVGGLVGANGHDVTGCYSVGPVTGTGDFVGGLVGCPWVAGRMQVRFNGHVIACLWDTQTSSQTTSAGGTGKTTAEMQMAKTFLGAGWDFVGETANGTEDIWWILEGKDYPRLWWELLDDKASEPAGK